MSQGVGFDVGAGCFDPVVEKEMQIGSTTHFSQKHFEVVPAVTIEGQQLAEILTEIV